MFNEPHLVRWTDHALVKAEMLGFAEADVEKAILEGHRRRTRNPGAADWLTEAGRLRRCLHYPDAGDELAALIVTLWRRA